MRIPSHSTNSSFDLSPHEMPIERAYWGAWQAGGRRFSFNFPFFYCPIHPR
jgi:hypothetical protein